MDSRCHDNCDVGHFARNLNSFSYTSLVSLHTQFGQGNLDTREWRICTLPTPRNVKMTWRIWAEFVVLVLVAAVEFFAFGEYARVLYRLLKNRGPAKFVVAFLTLLPLLILYVLLRHNISEYSLLKRGRCVVGRVISQRRVKVGRGSRSEIDYAFPVGPGKPMTGSGIDRTGFYLEDMPVLVFFAPDDISKNVAYCSSGWQVRLEDGTLLEP